MPYLIDGHNLIPHVRGLSLSAMDDELELIALLQAFCREKRKQVEVYFDGAPHGYPVRRGFGLVTAVFVPQGMIADEAIRLRLHKLGKAARNWTVVSADHQVQAEARAVHAQVIASGVFAAEIDAVRGKSRAPQSSKPMSPAELDEWLHLFGDKN
ncbi:MAG TPA: NYN domain-containing protein [Anaerolineaceae bacterium]